MAIYNRQKFDDFVRGSDTTWHHFHMLLASFNRVIIVGSSVALVVFLIPLFVLTSGLQREVLVKHYAAAAMASFGLTTQFTLNPRPPEPPIILPAPQMAEATSEAVGLLGLSFGVWFFISIYAGFIAANKLYQFQKTRGVEDAKDVHVRGQKIVSEDDLSAMTRPLSLLGYSIGKVRIPDKLLARNVGFIGVMGSGKSQSVFNFIDSARPATKAVIYDVTGEFVERFYDKERGDIILNPFDERCASWSIYDDLRSEVDYTTLAEYFVEQSKNDANPVFGQAARLLLSDVLKIIQFESGMPKTMGQVTEVLFQSSLKQLFTLAHKYGLPSAGVISPDNEKTSEGVRFQLASQVALRYFRLFDGFKESFSIRNFIESDSKAWLFITSKPEQHSVIKPFAAAWLEIAMLAAMAGRPIDHTRILFVIDELASLPYLKALEIGLTQGRKYGIASVLGFQSMPQLDHIYGDAVAKVLFSNLQTKCVFRTEDSATATMLADTLGKAELDEASANQSFGVEAQKDGAGIARKRAEINVVLPSQIQTLPDLSGFLKVAGAYPLAKVEIIPKDRKIKSPAYQLKPIERLEDIYPERSSQAGAGASVEATETDLGEEESDRQVQNQGLFD